MAKFLIADDAKIMRLSIKNLLTTLGHKVVGEASSGYGAIEEYKRLMPDVITLDISMPQENSIADGIIAVQKIIEFDPNAKIIMITSNGEQAKVIKAIQSGALNYMLKPLKIETLKEILDKVIK